MGPVNWIDYIDDWTEITIRVGVLEKRIEELERIVDRLLNPEPVEQQPGAEFVEVVPSAGVIFDERV